MVGAAGFELATYWSQTSCATRLRYAPNNPDCKGAALRHYRGPTPFDAGDGSINCRETSAHWRMC